MSNPAPPAQPLYPSLATVVCPNCGSGQFTPVGTKGATGKAAVGALFGAAGNLIANAVSRENFDFAPLGYKCDQCRKKFETAPLVATADEVLPVPCRVVFTRKRSFVGMAVAQNVWLNGVKIGPVGNGKTLEFATPIAANMIFVTDQYGQAFKGCYRFVAQPGGLVEVSFNRKFT